MGGSYKEERRKDLYLEEKAVPEEHHLGRVSSVVLRSGIEFMSLVLPLLATTTVLSERFKPSSNPPEEEQERVPYITLKIINRSRNLKISL
ncbi:hypothetical protein H4Q26_008126 [Puccinia striiformis f. sp. tritici PST-130]|nr:hypothetical protein H4Q26_008126 [Puccinia striiformis f. sp. tritici PST-130]